VSVTEDEDANVNILVKDPEESSVYSNESAAEIKTFKSEDPEEESEVPVSVFEQSPEISRLRDEQLKDDSLKVIWSQLKGDEPVKEFKGYFLNPGDDLLYHKEDLGLGEITQLVLPKSRRQQVLELGHSSILANHQSSKRTLYRITQAFYWPKIREAVQEFCKTCEACQLIRRKTVYDNTVFHPVKHVELLFDTFSMDIAGPLLKATNGMQYLLVVVDQYSKWVEMEGLSEISSKSTCLALLKIFARTSIARHIVSDQGSNFTSKLTKSFEG